MPYVFTRLGSGLNTKAPATAINDPELQTAENCRYDLLGAVKSRRGRELVSDEAAGLRRTIHGYGEYVTESGVANRIAKSGKTVYENEVPIYDTGNAKDISVVSYNGYAYITDGKMQKRYSGGGTTGVEQWGLNAPSGVDNSGSAGTDERFIAGANTNSGSMVGAASAAYTYKYAVTYFNDRCESNLYPDYDSIAVAATIPQGSTTGSIPLTLPIPPAGSSATGRRIYSTAPDGNVFFELAQIDDITTTSYLDTRDDGAGRLPEADADSTAIDEATDAVRTQDFSIVDEREAYRRIRGFNANAQNARQSVITDGDAMQRTMTNLGVLANWTDHNPPPTDIKNLRMLNGQMFGTSGNSLRWSRTYEVEHWPDFNEVPIGRQGGETLLTIEPFGDNAMACYTTSGLYLFEQLGISAQDSRLKQIPTPVGCWGEGAVTRLENGAHLFGGGDAIYLFDGERVQEISFTVDGLFLDPENTDYFTPEKRSSVVAGSYRDKAYFAYSTFPAESQSNRNNRLLFLDMEDVSAPRFSVHTGNFSTLARSEFSNLLIGGTYRGKLVTMDKGAVDEEENVEDFLFEARTKEFSFEEGETVVKRIQQVIVDCDVGGGLGEIEVRALLDGKAITATKSVRTSGRERIKFRVPPVVQGHTVSVKFSRRSNKERAIYGVGFEYEVVGGI